MREKQAPRLTKKLIEVRKGAGSSIPWPVFEATYERALVLERTYAVQIHNLENSVQSPEEEKPKKDRGRRKRDRREKELIHLRALHKRINGARTIPLVIGREDELLQHLP